MTCGRFVLCVLDYGVRFTRYRFLAANETVVRQGEDGTSCFFVLSGSVKVMPRMGLSRMSLQTVEISHLAIAATT